MSRRDFWRILYEIVKKGVSILVTTAYLDEAERCDRIGLMDQGKVLVTGPPHDIKQLMQGKILTIKSLDARKINKLLQEELTGVNGTVFGDTVHIVCQQIQKTQDKALELIQAAGLGLDEIKEAQPSLEDVFNSMMSKGKGPDDPLDVPPMEPDFQSADSSGKP